MAEKPKSTEIEDILECQLCFEKCEDPRFLPCHHWFCTSCLTKLIETADFSSRFPCPNCRVDVPIPPGKARDFPAAFMINKLKEAVSKENEAVPKGKRKCAQHGKELDMYCDKCQKSICSKCIKQHSGHPVVDVDEVKERNQKPSKELKEQLLGKLRYYEGRMDEVINAKTICRENGTKNKNEIKMHCKKIIKETNSFGAKMQQDIDTVVAQTMKQYEELEAIIAVEMSRLSEAIGEVEDSLQEEIPGVADLQSYKQLLQQQVEASQEIPEIAFILNLSDVNSLSQATLIGELECHLGKMIKLKDGENMKSTRKVSQFKVSYAPYGITWVSDDKMAVCGGSRVHIHTAGGRDVTSIKIPGPSVWDVAWHDGILFVTEWGTQKGRVFVYDERLKHLGTIEVGYKDFGGIAVTDRCMYVTSNDEHRVYRLDTSDGSSKRVFARSGEGVNKPCFIAANESHVAVSCTGNHTVVVFDTEGTQQFVYGGEGSGPGQLYKPKGVAFDHDHYGRILVSDYHHRISEVSLQGRHIQDIHLDQDGPKYPRGLAVNGSGKVVVGCGDPQAIIVYDYM